MKSILTLAVFTALLHSVALGTPADRLKELDHLRKEGLISEEAYRKRWKEVIDSGITPERAPKHRTEPRGRAEVNFSGSWLGLSAGGVDLDLLSAQINVGLMVSPNLQLTVGGTGIRAEIEDLDLTAVGGTLGANYLFMPENVIVPYLGAGATYVYADLDGDTEEDDWAWEVRGGFKQYVRPNVAITYQIAYQQFDKLELDGVAATIGLAFTF